MRTYKTYNPQALNSVVRRIVVIRETDPEPRFNSIPYYADGLPGIYFQKSEYDVLLNTDERKLSKLFLYGQTVDPITIDTVGEYTVIIFQLYPTAIKTLFGIDAHELTGTCIDYEYLAHQNGYDLKNRMLESVSVDRQIQILKDSLLKLLEEIQPSIQNGIYHAAENIVQSGGLISLKSLHQELGVSERTFQRQFLRHVGVSPSQFKSIIRFHMAFNSLKNNRGSLSQITYRHGYADQSHFIRIFKRFTGKTPTEYRVAYNYA